MQPETNQNPAPTPAPETNPLPVAPAAPVEQAEGPAPTVPETWPGAWGLYKFSRDSVKYNLSNYLLLLLLPFIFGTAFSVFGLPEAVNNLVSFVVSVTFGVASTIVILAAIRGSKVLARDALKQSFSMLSIKYAVLSIVTGVLLLVSLIALIVPFFFVFPRILLASYYLIDKNLGIFESLSASWNATKGHVGKVYGIVGASIAMALLFVTIIGIPFAIYFLVMYSAASPLLYLFILKNQTAATPPVTPAAFTAPQQ